METKAARPGDGARDLAIDAIRERHGAAPDRLLPILSAIQAELGHVPASAVARVAEALNLSRAEVHGVVTFYHDYRLEPAELPVIRLCRAEACQARGVDRIAPLFEEDGRIAVAAVYCLGLCASGPSAMVGERVFARRDEISARALIEESLR
jgi:formate dehydrogenase subunit gamma